MTERHEWMTLFALSKLEDLERHWGGLSPMPTFSWVRRPEIGAVAITARASRTGALFELGEMTVTRCSLRLVGGEVGHAYIAGRDKRHAAIAAAFDAVLQSSSEVRNQMDPIIADLSNVLNARRSRTSAQSYSSVVDFVVGSQEQA